MQTEKVLLRRGDGQRWQQVGIIVSVRGKVLSVLLPDGTTVEHERGKDEITPDAGSLTHLARIAPEVVVAALEQDPAMVYTQALKEAGKRIRGTDPQQKKQPPRRGPPRPP